MQYALLDFYLASGTDNAGRTFDGVLALDYRALETSHDYIQWIFPLMTQSSSVSDAPRLDAAAVRVLQSSPIARARAIRALHRMLTFYGLDLDESDPDEPYVDRGTGWAGRSAHWVTPGNHNHLRLTRILMSLQLLGLAGYSSALFDCLESIYREHGGKIGKTTWEHWRRARY